AADVNGDGRNDLLVANQTSGDVSVYVNQGDGSFGTPDFPGAAELRGQQFRAGPGPFGMNDTRADVRSRDQSRTLAAGDFNRDGRLDVVVGAAGANGLAVLLGQGAGGLLNPRAVPLGFSPAFVVAGQFSDDNGDGRIDGRDNLDLAVLDRQGE